MKNHLFLPVLNFSCRRSFASCRDHEQRHQSAEHMHSIPHHTAAAALDTMNSTVRKFQVRQHAAPASSRPHLLSCKLLLSTVQSIACDDLFQVHITQIVTCRHQVCVVHGLDERLHHKPTVKARHSMPPTPSPCRSAAKHPRPPNESKLPHTLSDALLFCFFTDCFLITCTQAQPQCCFFCVRCLPREYTAAIDA